jgi:NAD(P)-dependent dehydrogenase (short-subunit alcohol dehydrogenase family)
VSDFLGQLFSLEGRTAIVTGGSRGIGAAIANGFARVGAQVLAVARSTERPTRLLSEVAYASCDVTATAAFEAVCGDVARRTGRLDILVNAAAVSLPPKQAGELERFDDTIDANLRAVYAACLSAASQMERSGGGAIINITSINSVLGFPANPGYVASKGGLRMLTRALAIDLAPNRIRVNALAPGYIRTAMTATSYADPVLRADRLDRMIIQRWGEPDDLVGAAIFLASPASSYVTGIDLFVDGGWTAKGL